ncbi:hypothetical protein amb0644 [Paramagnetospirillum magneticum AMB-1]|uniref:Uracil-DNA glycosylase-like domain-containing protein n=2 Tax=Paramagnetospirillum magneticum TaxID=84159 RepID=Q2W9M7_PARM1|nr:hypothetical protein amb0644 [Paramagnetospirillum magneticum AMB-1]
MFAGYVGGSYRPGGIVLLAVNPGGGGDAYQQTAEDVVFYPLLKAFRDCAPEKAEALFGRINDEFASVLPRWNLWRILKPTLDAAGVGLDEVAYLNAVPYRTRENRVPKLHAKEAAWRMVTGPTLDALRPGLLIALGNKAGDVMTRLYNGSASTECVPRTNGDSYISDGAKSALKRIACLRSA